MKTIKSWYDISGRNPQELVSGYVENANSLPELIRIPRISWAYYNWLKNEQGLDFTDWIKAHDINREHPDETFSEAIRDGLYTLYVMREEDGEPRPPWLPPYTE